MSYAAIGQRADALGLALRGGFHPSQDDGIEAATILMLGWTGGAQWPVFAASPEFADGQRHPLDRWSRRVVGQLAAEFDARPLYPFAGPPFLPFLRWAAKAEALASSPIGLLIHPRWGLWHAWRGALAFTRRLDVPAPVPAPAPCAACPRPCLQGGRPACPVGAPYPPPQAAFHDGARHGISSGRSSPD